MVAPALKTGARCVSPYEHPWVGLLYSDVQVGAWIATPKLRLAKVEYYYRCHSVLVFQVKEFELLSPYLNNYSIFRISVFRNYFCTTLALCSRLYFDSSVIVERNRTHAMVYKRIVTMLHCDTAGVSTDHVDTCRVRSFNILRDPLDCHRKVFVISVLDFYNT